jgi:hypothetical protein
MSPLSHHPLSALVPGSNGTHDALGDAGNHPATGMAVTPLTWPYGLRGAKLSTASARSTPKGMSPMTGIVTPLST